MGYGVAMRTRSYRHRNAEERETLSLGLACGHSVRAMAAVLRRAPSTVSRELARNAMRAPYRACTAQTLATARARQPRRPRNLLDPWLWPYVRTPLAEGCSPKQIAGRLKRADPHDMATPLSAETILWGPVCAALRCSEERTAAGAVSGARDRSTRPDPPYDADDRAPHRGGRPHGTGPLGKRFQHASPQWLAGKETSCIRARWSFISAFPYSPSTLLAHVRDMRSLTRRIPPRQCPGYTSHRRF